jgi:hypothetical protein
LGEVVDDGVGGGQCLFSGLDGNGAVTPCSLHEFLYFPTSSVLDPVGYGHRGEHDRQVVVDRFTFVVIDRASLQVVLGHAEAFLDVPQAG